MTTPCWALNWPVHSEGPGAWLTKLHSFSIDFATSYETTVILSDLLRFDAVFLYASTDFTKVFGFIFTARASLNRCNCSDKYNVLCATIAP